MSLLIVSALLGIGSFAIFGALQLWLSWFPDLHPEEKRLRQYNAIACGAGCLAELLLMTQFSESAPWLLTLPASLIAPIWFNEKERVRLMNTLATTEATNTST